MATKKTVPPAFWSAVAQFYVGLFFLSAGYLKATRGLFGPHAHPLKEIFEYWLRIDWPVTWFRPLISWGIGHSDAIAIMMILGQLSLGILLILRVAPRVAGVLLIVVHTLILLATYHQTLLHVLVFQTMWVGLFFMFRGRMKDAEWRWMTVLLVIIGLVHLWHRVHFFHDLSPDSMLWQRKHFSENVMSLTPGIKQLYLWVMNGLFGPFLWIGSWWLRLLLTLGLLTRFRLQCGVAWMLSLMLLTIVWLSEWTCEGVFFVLTLFVWVTYEYERQQTQKRPLKGFLWKFFGR